MQCVVQLGSSQWSSYICSISTGRCVCRLGVWSKIVCYIDLSTTTQILSFRPHLNLQLKPEALSAVLISCDAKDTTKYMYVGLVKIPTSNGIFFCSSLVAYQSMAQPHRYIATEIY